MKGKCVVSYLWGKNLFNHYFPLHKGILLYILKYRKIHNCYVCREAIRGRVITAMAKKFHPQCFVCTYCRKEFKERSFKTDPIENRPYCYGCFEKLLGYFGNAHINDVIVWLGFHVLAKWKSSQCGFINNQVARYHFTKYEWSHNTLHI